MNAESIAIAHAKELNKSIDNGMKVISYAIFGGLTLISLAIGLKRG